MRESGTCRVERPKSIVRPKQPIHEPVTSSVSVEVQPKGFVVQYGMGVIHTTILTVSVNVVHTVCYKCGGTVNVWSRRLVSRHS